MASENDADGDGRPDGISDTRPDGTTSVPEVHLPDAAPDDLSSLHDVPEVADVRANTAEGRPEAVRPPAAARRPTDDEIFAAMVADFDTLTGEGGWHASEDLPPEAEEPPAPEPPPAPFAPPRPPSITPWRARVVRPVEDGLPFGLDDRADAEDDGLPDEVIPPLPPAKFDPFVILCWVLVIGGFLTLLASGVATGVDAGWQLVAGVAVLCGLGTLIFRMRDHDGPDDADSNGAVV